MPDDESREIEVLVRYAQGKIEIEIDRINLRRDEVRPFIGMLSNRVNRFAKRGVREND